MLRKILVPLDDSEHCRGILHVASPIARSLGASLLLLTVVDMDALGPHTLTIEVTVPKELVEATAHRLLNEVAKDLEADGVNAETLVVFGRPAEEIVRIAGDTGCDLIAMSTHGRTPLVRGVLGSVTDKVLRSVDVPLLTISPDAAHRYRQDSGADEQLIVPLDGSRLAEAALPYTEYLAQGLTAKVLLVRVVKQIGAESPYSMAMLSASDASDLQEQVEREAAEYIEGIAGGLERKGIEVEHRLLTGAPAQNIADLSQKASRSLVVMTTHGRSGLMRWVLGSVTDALIRTSGDAVLVIPTGATQ